MQENDIHTHVVAVCGIVKNEKNNTYLLAKRHQNDPQAGGEWSFPGGKVDLDVGKYVIEETLQKEIMEEVGVEIKDEIKFIYDDAFIRVSGHHVIMMTFLCFLKSGEAKPLEDQEEVKWFTLEELKKARNTMPHYVITRIDALVKYETQDQK